MSENELLRLSTQIVAAYVEHNQVSPAELPDIIRSVYNALKGIETAPLEVISGPQQPAVPIKKSIFPGYIVCLEDGKKLKMLKRHLMTAYGMTPDQYRTKWRLPSTYPMTAPDYAERRSELAKGLGLGRNRSVSVDEPVQEEALHDEPPVQKIAAGVKKIAAGVKGKSAPKVKAEPVIAD
jgi:predicted transcriptional regulator